MCDWTNEVIFIDLQDDEYIEYIEKPVIMAVIQITRLPMVKEVEGHVIFARPIIKRLIENHVFDVR